MRRTLHKALPWLAIAGLFGCAREARNPGYAPALASNGWVTPAGYAWPPRVVSGAETGPSKSVPARTARPAPAQAKSLEPGPKALPPARIATLFPGGESCLARLSKAGVRFRPSEPKRGVTTPVVIEGPIGGVEFWSHGGPMITDCRLALALSEVLPELRALGVTRMRFSGAYVYRMARVGRLSLHAHGLALDVHEIVAFGRSFEVKHDFARGLERACDGASPIVNQIACRLKNRRIFKEFLTPDDNADHHDHLHLAIAPEPEPST